MELAFDTVVGGRYRVEARLGSGAMGVVYRVRHTKLNRPFAIKVLHPSLVANQKLRRRFQREAEIASSLRHRNVVGVVDVGEHDDLAYIVMELADGTPLSTLMLEAPLAAPTVIDCARQLCDGLQHAHEAGLIHRDFKPDNIIVERERTGGLTLRIIDFGIAMLSTMARDEASQLERERLTTEGIVLGTPHYMAPEHASGEQVDHRIDLFALGVICFEMLTGKMPFEGDGVDVARANIMYDPPAMSVRVPYLEVDPLLEAFTRKLMARQRDRRFASAKAARDVLDLIEHDRALAATELGLKPTARPVQGTPPVIARPMLAMPIVTPRRAPSNTMEPELSSMLPAEVPRTDKIQSPRRRFRASVIGAGIATFIMGTVLAVGMTSSDHHAASQIADTAEHQSPAIVLKATPPPVREQAPPMVVEEPVPAPPAPPSGPAPRQFLPKPVSPSVAKQVPSRPLGEVPAEGPTAVEVAQLYGSVGRALGQLQQTKGSDATIDLWPRFRHIRINDSIATAAARREAQQLLVQLQRDVAARRTR